MKRPQHLRTPLVKHATSAFIAALFLSAAAPASAEVDALVKQARALLEKGQAQPAFELLEPQEAKRAGDVDFDTALGIAANETNQHTRAVFALERVLSVQPENARARAELGRALFSVGDNVAARKVLMETKRENIPAEATAVIDQFLQAIDRNEADALSSTRFYVETSLGYDSNINSGPANANVAVPAFGGLVLALNQSGIANKDTVATLGAGVSGRYVLDPRWSLLANASVNQRWHAQLSSVDSLQIDANVGTSYRYDKHEFVGAVQAGSYYANAAKVRDQLGLVGEWTYRINGEQQFSSYLQWGTLSYPGQTARNANRTVIGTSYAQGLSNGMQVYGGVYVGTEAQKDSAFPHLGHRLYGIRTGGQQRLAEGLNLFAGLSYENRKYGGPDPLFLATRQDDQFNFNVGLTWVPAKSWRVTPQINYTKVKSNIVISDFDRTVFSVTVRKDF